MEYVDFSIVFFVAVFGSSLFASVMNHETYNLEVAKTRQFCTTCTWTLPRTLKWAEQPIKNHYEKILISFMSSSSLFQKMCVYPRGFPDKQPCLSRVIFFLEIYNGGGLIKIVSFALSIYGDKIFATEFLVHPLVVVIGNSPIGEFPNGEFPNGEFPKRRL